MSAVDANAPSDRTLSGDCTTVEKDGHNKEETEQKPSNPPDTTSTEPAPLPPPTVAPPTLKRGGKRVEIRPILPQQLDIKSVNAAAAEAAGGEPVQPRVNFRPSPFPASGLFETNRSQGLQSAGVLRHPTHDRNRTSRQTDRMSTGPVDIAEAQRQLDIQQLDDNQRQRVEEFLAGKQIIDELRPEDFKKLSELGAGNWGVVSRVRHLTTGLIMAKKTIRLDIKHEVRTQIIRELEILHDCTSPYIIGYYGAFFADGNISICMEYMDGGSLDMVLKHAGRMPEPIVSRILYAVLRGLVYLRRHLSMIHRDVKPSNILVRRNGEVKLCDFGASGKLIDSVAHSFVGSRSYMAPERISGKPYNTSSDVWSLGLTLIELATGRYPIPAIEDESLYFSGFSPDRDTNLKEHITAASEGLKLRPVTTPNAPAMSIFDLLVYIVEQPLPRLPSTCFNDNFIDLTAQCLRVEHTERPSLEELLLHPFVVTVAGTCQAGGNRHSSIRYSTYDTASGFPSHGGDPDLADIAFYLEKVLPPLDDTDTTSAPSGTALSEPNCWTHMRSSCERKIDHLHHSSATHGPTARTTCTHKHICQFS
ncbi:hypothetical protein AAHC03_026050 [Spirometra sp. Aus1]